MTFEEIVNDTFIAEAVKHNSLLLLDIDDTLVKAQGINIYKIYPDGKEEVLTPQEFAEENVPEEEKKGIKYSYRDFRDPDKVARSIKTGLPIVSNLKTMDNYIQNGWKIGILTARGLEDVMGDVMKEWLKFKNEKGELEKVGPKLIKDLVFAINDDTKHYPGEGAFEKKANIIKKLAKQYDRIVFIDDDKKNINTVKDMLQKNNIKNVIPRLAKS